MTFDDFRFYLINRKIVSWNGDNEITLDSGLRIAIEETAQDCCAAAFGRFENVKLDAVIIGVTEPNYSPWEECDTYGCRAEVKILYNDLDFCRATGDADAGNGGYYYSLASFVVRPSDDSNILEVIDFVSSEDK